METKLGPILQALVKARGANMVLDRQAMVYAPRRRVRHHAGGHRPAEPAATVGEGQSQRLCPSRGAQKVSPQKARSHGRSPLFRKSRPLYPGADLRKGGIVLPEGADGPRGRSSISQISSGSDSGHLTFFSGAAGSAGCLRGQPRGRLPSAGPKAPSVRGTRRHDRAGDPRRSARLSPPSPPCSILNIPSRVWPRDTARFRQGPNRAVA